MTDKKYIPAFPLHAPATSHFGPMTYYGMSLKEWYAGQALQGILAGQLAAGVLPTMETFPQVACAAFEFADAMMAEREKRL